MPQTCCFVPRNYLRVPDLIDYNCPCASVSSTLTEQFLESFFSVFMGKEAGSWTCVNKKKIYASYVTWALVSDEMSRTVRESMDKKLGKKMLLWLPA